MGGVIISIYSTPSQIHGFHIITKIHSLTSIGTALLYTKVLHEGRTVHIIKQNKTIHKIPKKKRKFTYIKVLYNVGKTAQNCYKKVEEHCEAAPLLLSICT